MRTSVDVASGAAIETGATVEKSRFTESRKKGATQEIILEGGVTELAVGVEGAAGAMEKGVTEAEVGAGGGAIEWGDARERKRRSRS